MMAETIPQSLRDSSLCTRSLFTFCAVRQLPLHKGAFLRFMLRDSPLCTRNLFVFYVVLRVPLLGAFLFVFATAFIAIGRILKFNTLQNAY